MKKTFLLLLSFIIHFSAVASTVDTINVYSSSMHKTISTVVIKPNSYKHKKNKFSVVYLLHGYSNNYSDWVKRVPIIKQYADQMNLIFVCPDGGYSSWYFDSPIDSTYKYDTYVSTELVNYIDKNYHTIADRNHRAITGLSMGGHGALYLALNHPDVFGAAGSMSGGVDLRPFPKNWDISKRIGNATDYQSNWERYSVTNIVEHYKGPSLSIIIDCGTEDFFYTVNKQLHEKMLRLKIPHDYIEKPGIHGWDYWKNAIEYQAIFFKNYFNTPTS